ncbi:MAG: hypothetical protein BWY80_00723 [Firmicutes bacterium ADurb.Bin456]|nr:MAG: hypothetical protein BWY80_00723 [Firmicutes bacterium ADurb.Bin456]
MAFEVYKPGKREMKVKISKNIIVLDQPSLESFNTKAIELAYDNDRKIIKIQPSKDGHVLRNKKKIYAKGFFNCFNISKKGLFGAKYDKSKDTLYVDLNKELSQL